MKIICTGMPKTGTKSICAALRILDYTVYDFEEQVWLIGDKLLSVLNNGCTNEEIREIYKGVDATTDAPTCFIWDLVYRAFPDVKVIHCERDTDEEWLKSLINQAAVVRNNVVLQVLFRLSYTGRKLLNVLNSSFRVGCSWKPSSPWNYRSINPEVTKLRYREHNSHVKNIVPKDRLLQFNLSDGWGPLCEFLNVPIPKKKFPHQNKKGEIVGQIMEEAPIFRRIKREFIFVVTVLVVCMPYILYNLF